MIELEGPPISWSYNTQLLKRQSNQSAEYISKVAALSGR